MHTRSVPFKGSAHGDRYTGSTCVNLKTRQLKTRAGQGSVQGVEREAWTLVLPPRVMENREEMSLPPTLWSSDTPQLTGTSNASWVSSSIWILMDMSFPEGVGGGFCPCSNVLIPEFSGAPSRDPGLGLCSISPMVKADYTLSAENSEKEKYIRGGDSFQAPKGHRPSPTLPWIPGTTARWSLRSPPSKHTRGGFTHSRTIRSPSSKQNMQIVVRILYFLVLQSTLVHKIDSVIFNILFSVCSKRHTTFTRLESGQGMINSA